MLRANLEHDIVPRLPHRPGNRLFELQLHVSNGTLRQLVQYRHTEPFRKAALQVELFKQLPVELLSHRAHLTIVWRIDVVRHQPRTQRRAQFFDVVGGGEGDQVPSVDWYIEKQIPELIPAVTVEHRIQWVNHRGLFSVTSHT